MHKLHLMAWLVKASADFIIFQLMLKLLVLLSNKAHTCLLSAVESLSWLDLNDALWLLYLSYFVYTYLC